MALAAMRAGFLAGNPRKGWLCGVGGQKENSEKMIAAKCFRPIRGVDAVRTRPRENGGQNSPFFRYAIDMGKWCTVTVTDGGGQRHSLDVNADSSYDAALLYLTHVRGNPGCGLPFPTSSTPFEGRHRRPYSQRSRCASEEMDREPAAGVAGAEGSIISSKANDRTVSLALKCLRGDGKGALVTVASRSDRAVIPRLVGIGRQGLGGFEANIALD